MKRILIVVFLAHFFMMQVRAQGETDHTYTFTEGPDKNPMKGWNSGWWDDLDIATVGFQYIKWNEFEPTDGSFDFDYVEEVINRPGSSGRHLILRLYTDWFGNDQVSDAGPQWLYDDYGVARLQSPNGKYITDYNDPNYISQVKEAIEALANQYNNDPRMYVVQLGVLGYWGEWHTFTFNDDNFDITFDSKTQIIETYKSNFSNVEIMGRQPWDEPLTSTGNIGFHNDFFVPNNGHSNEFDVSVDENNQWMQGPIGGESPPINDNDQEQYMIDLYETPTGMEMITKGHYSTMQLGDAVRPSCDNGQETSRCQAFMELHRKMGYNYQITNALFAETLTQSDNLSVDLAITNIGVAPMYYDWDVQFALLNESNEPVALFETPYDVRSILPDGSSYAIPLSTSLEDIPVANYKLATRIIQPGSDTSKTNAWELEARNTYILLSNELSVVEGSWDSNNSLVGGWSILGNIVVQESSLGIDNTILDTSVKLYPNPTKDLLNLVKSDVITLQSMALFDYSGRLLRTVNLEKMSDTKTIDISNLAAGIYHITIQSENGQLQRRLIKQ